MANMVRQIFEQKLQEIQGRLPFGITLVSPSKDTLSFKEVLQQTENVQKQSTLQQMEGYIPNTFYSASVNQLYPGQLYAQQLYSNLGTYLPANTNYDWIIAQTAGKYGVDPALVKAVIKVESNFNPLAISSAGAMGLMQLMPGTAESLGVLNPFDPIQNIDGGVRYLQNLLARFNGNIDLALAAYNCGPARIESNGITDLNDPDQFAKLPAETRSYIQKIRQYLGY